MGVTTAQSQEQQVRLKLFLRDKLGKRLFEVIRAIEATGERRPLDNSSKARLGMGSRAAQHFHRRSPSQHRVLASIIDDMNKDAGINKMVQLKSSGGRVTNVPGNIEAMEVEQENLERRTGRPEKKVTWSRDLLQVRSISPRQKSSRVAESSRTSRMSDAVNAFRGGSIQEGGDCGHFLCQRVGVVCLQGGGGDQEHQGGGNLRPGYQSLPCSPQMQTVVWRSIPINRTSNNNNKRAGLSLDLGNAFLQGEGLV